MAFFTDYITFLVFFVAQFLKPLTLFGTFFLKSSKCPKSLSLHLRDKLCMVLFTVNPEKQKLFTHL
jgi:hypothetical protein